LATRETIEGGGGGNQSRHRVKKPSRRSEVIQYCHVKDQVEKGMGRKSPSGEGNKWRKRGSVGT